MSEQQKLIAVTAADLGLPAETEGQVEWDLWQRDAFVTCFTVGNYFVLAWSTSATSTWEPSQEVMNIMKTIVKLQPPVTDALLEVLRSNGSGTPQYKQRYADLIVRYWHKLVEKNPHLADIEVI